MTRKKQKQKQTKTKNVERHAGGLSKLKYTSFVLFLLVIVLSVLLRFTAFDYPLGIFKLLIIVLHVVL
jgi:hypothetical protein